MRKFLSLLMATFFCVALWAQAPAGTTLFSENFGGYAANDVPSGSVSSLEGSRVVYGGGSVTYTSADNGKNLTKIYTEALASGTSPELLVGKSGGVFTVAGIPSGNAKEITVSFKQNAQKLTVSLAGNGYSTEYASPKPAAAGQITFDVTVADGADATFSIIMTAGSSNVRVDDILVTVKTAGEGGEQEGTVKTVYCKVTQGWWTEDGAATGIYAYADGNVENAAWPGVRMEEVEGEDGLWKADIDTAVYHNIIFTRFNPSDEGNQDWGAKTGDLQIPADKDLYTITSTAAVWGDPGVTGEWSVYGEGGDDPVVPTYYVKGSFNNWGDGMEMTEGTYTFEDLAAGTYQIKVTDGDQLWLGYAVLDKTKSSANIYEGSDGNIKFTLAEAGNVTVAYANSKITVTGTFVAPTTKFTVTVPEGTEKAYIAGNFNNWTPAEMTLKAGEEDVFELTVEGVESDTVAYKYLAGADWKFEEVIESNRSYNAADEVSAWKAVPTIYKYAKVKEAPVNWTGHYIIAWADHKPHSAIKVGSSSKDDFVAADDALVFTDGDTISIMEGLDFAVNIRFGASEGAYTLQLPDGKYIYLPNANGVCSKDEATDMYLAVSPSTTQTGIQIGDKADMSNRVIYNNNTNYRSYTNKYEATGYNLPTLYRLVNEPFDCLDGPYGVLINGKDVVVAEALAGEEEYDAAGRKQYRAYLNLEKEDIIQIVNTSCGSAWLPAIEEGGMSAHFDADDEMAVIDTTGCFDLYIKMKSGDDKIYIGAGICADDTIRYTVRGKGGILGEDFENAIDSKQDTLELALEAGKYELKVIVGADWKGFEQLTDTATGLKVGDQGNICFELNEAGAVSIVYNDSVFKLIGNFYIAPIKYYIAGSMSKWAEEMVELLPLEEKADSLGIAINLEADSLYAFKVVRVQGTDTAWYGLGEAATMEYGNSEGWWVYKSEGDNNQANVGLMTTKAAEYPFVVKVADGHMEVSVVIPEPEAKLPVVGFGANFNDWDWTENLFVPAEDSLSASFKITLGVTDTIEFKIVSDGKWLSLYGENGKYLIHRDWNHADHVNATGEVPNFAFNADAEGEYIFTWTYADSTLVVTFPAAPAQPKFKIAGSMTDWAPSIEVFEDSYTFENLAAGSYKFKVVDGDWIGFDALTADTRAAELYKDQDGNVCFVLAEAGNVTVTYTEEVFKVEGAFVPALVQLIGINGWTAETDAIDMTPAEDHLSASVTLNLTGWWYEFKVLLEGAWLGKAHGDEGKYMINNGWNHVEGLTYEGDNIVLSMGDGDIVPGSYTFTYEYASGKLTVTFPTNPTALDEIMAAGKAVKIVRNGQILIVKGEKIFNVQGQRVK